MPSISEELLDLNELPSLERPQLDLVIRHWNSLRGNRAMPARREIDPFAIKAALGLVIIAQHVPQGDDFRFTLFGSLIAQAMGRDYTGRLASELEPESYAQRILESYRAVQHSGMPRLTRISIGGPVAVVSYLRLLLPLGNDGKTVDALLIVSDNEKHFWRSLTS